MVKGNERTNQAIYMILNGRDAFLLAKSARFISTGSEGLDRLLGGGHRVGHLALYFGTSNSGKTQVAMQAALMAAKEGRKVLFLDSEGAFRPERIEAVANARGWDSEPILERIFYLRVDSAAQQSDAVRRIDANNLTAGTSLVVVDTLTRNFTLDLPGAMNLVQRQESLGVHLSEMARDAVIARRAFVLTNRVTFGPDEDEVPVGGATVEQGVGKLVHLRRSPEGIVASDKASGGRVTVSLGGRGVG